METADRRRFTFLIILALSGLAGAAPAPAKAQETNSALKFDFGSGALSPGYTQVLPTSAYSKEGGFGFEPGEKIVAGSTAAADALTGDYLTSDQPFIFSVTMPEGNYRIRLTFAGPAGGESNVTVKAESRRLMLNGVRVPAGQFITRTIIVNVHMAALPAGGHVHLKPRDIGERDWDDKLSLEFNGQRPCVCGVEIEKAQDVHTVFIAGDSTVTDQANEPWCGWGQMLPLFFDDKIAVANYAESGASLKSFLGSHRWEKLLSGVKKGDWVMIQFAHNDEKDKSADAGPFKSYKKLLEKFVADVRRLGGNPVLVTPMHRRRFDRDGKIINTHGEFPAAMRQAAGETNVPLIDLLNMSQRLYEAWGPEQSKKAFVFYPAHTFPGQDKELKDNTHFNSYGAYELARCIVQGIKDDKLGLVEDLVDMPAFDPSRPDPIDSLKIPRSPLTPTEKPAGS